VATNYCTLADVKAALRISDSNDDTRLTGAIDSACRLIETECNRYFYQDPTVSARRYVSNDPWLVEVDDISTSAGLIVQSDYAGDGTFGTTWDPLDFQLEPVNGMMMGQPGWPTTKIRAIRSLYFPVWGGISYPKPYTQALVEVTARWGWAAVPTPIHDAAVIQAIAHFKAADVPFGATPFAEVGVVRLRQALHPTAAMLIAPYRDNPVLVA
jgi:hypothetical protein